MQFPHVFIAFLAREVRFSHGFIAFLLFIFLGVPRCPPRAIFCDFGRPLGASRGYLGAILAPYWLQLGHLGFILVLSWAYLGASLAILVTMLISWGVLWRSGGCLGLSLALTLTVWMSKPRQSQLSWPRMCVSFCSVYTYRLPSAPLLCIGHLTSHVHLICTFQSHLLRSACIWHLTPSRLRLSVAPCDCQLLLAPLMCTCYST